jgi:putative nucleotidyltransferase with HDIG domain
VGAGGESVASLGRRLSAAVQDGLAGGNGGGPAANGHRANGDGANGDRANGRIETPSRREIAVDVCAAILKETGAGTAEHSSDVVLITEVIGERMGIRGAQASDLLAAARLHDIGKAWVPRRILEKPGPLSDDEWDVMRQHTVVGEEILGAVDELADVGRIVRHSHERWDGRGYPDGLRGSDIPLGSRIVFCADAFHAIRSDRPYRKGRPAIEALAEIKRCAGTQFDPHVAAALEEVVRDRRRRPRGARASRLFALLMCLAVGGAGTALARSDLLGNEAAPASSAPAKPPPACGTATCPSVAGPVGGLLPIGPPGSTVPGPRAAHPGRPGRLQGAIEARKLRARRAKGDHGEKGVAGSDHAEKSNGKALGHTGGPQQSSEPASAGRAAPSSSSSSQGGRGRSGGSHGSSGSHRSSSHGSSGSSHSHGGGASGGGASHGNSGASGGSQKH